MPITMAVTNVVSKPTAVPAMMLVAGPVLDASAMSLTGSPAASRVVLRDIDEGDARREADDARQEEPDPGRDPVATDGARGIHHHVGGDRQADDRQERRRPVTAVEHLHGVLVLAPADEGHGHDRGQETEGSDDEREEDPRLGIGPAGRHGDRVDRDAEDHRADVLGSGRFEEVGAAAGAVTDVVADEVGDDRGIAGIVLGDARLDLADQVGSDVGGLRVDATAELREQRDEGGAEPEADDEERRLSDGHDADRVVDGEDPPDAQERERHDEEARDRPAAHGGLDRAHQARLCGCSGGQVGAHAHPHADDAGRHRADRSHEECDARVDAEVQPRDARVGDLRGLDDRDDGGDHEGPHDREKADRGVLAADEGAGALLDHAGDVLHRLRALVARQHVPSQIDRVDDRRDARRWG